MRKTFIYFVIFFAINSCGKNPKNYVTISGKISNAQIDDSLIISSGKTYKKVIPINNDGSFNDTLKIIDGDYRFKYGEDYGLIYLKNNNESSLTFDHHDFYNTLIYGGDDADINNFAIQNYLLANKYFSADMTYGVKKEDIDATISNYKSDYSKLKQRFNNVDSLHIANADLSVARNIQTVESLYASKVALHNALPKGSASPKFENYENYEGGATSLLDFKGKYVYILFWASWSMTSKNNFSILKQLELQYKDKNIVFVCISLDDTRVNGTEEKAKEVWRKSVSENGLIGVQLIADQGWKSDFVVKYQIKVIPSFVLIDPDGNIVSPDAPSPSNPKLIALFDTLHL